VIEQLERLHAAYGEHLRARNFSGVHAANDAFHLTMFAACGNTYLVESIKHYMWLSLPVRTKKTADYARAQASERDHFMIIQLLKGNDSWALAQCAWTICKLRNVTICESSAMCSQVTEVRLFVSSLCQCS